MRGLLACGPLLLTIATGCGEAHPLSEELSREEAKAPAVTAPAGADISADAYDDASPSTGSMMGAMATPSRAALPVMVAERAPESPPGAEPVPPPAEPGLSRKIIYNADISIVVEDFARAEPEVGRLVEASGGYIAELNLAGSPGSRRSARWKVRIPVETFDSFIEDIKKLGELERNQRTSQDVSEQYYDIEARIKNKKVEEETLVNLLKDRGGKLEDVLKFEVEISRVRGEIEQLEGRLRLLANLSSLTTVTIDLREREEFEPPPPTAPDFATIVGRTFQHSVDLLMDVGKAFVLFVVALAPWLPLILLALLLLWFFGRGAARLARRAWAAAQRPILPPKPADTP